MAQKAIREFYAKSLIEKYLPQFWSDFSWDYEGIQVKSDEVGKLKLPKWDKYVVKPDMLFGKRGKNGLIFIAANEKEVKKWIKEKSSKKIKVIRNEKDTGVTGKLTHFLIEPFQEHVEEYYVSIKTEREHDVIYFSEQGGVDIEENWDSVKEIKIPYSLEVDVQDLEKRIKKVVKNDDLLGFISGLYQTFKFLHFTYLELNPFVLRGDEIIPLDMVARIDTTAEYQMDNVWNVDKLKYEAPKPFGVDQAEAELEVEKLDLKSSSSLKLTILNPDGAIWLLTSGGGASVIFADTVADLGYFDHLANYGEYSGNPTTDETMAYCDLVIEEMKKSKAKNKKVIIGGGIANFTDVAKTFTGVIKSIEKNKDYFVKNKIPIFVRRGGPRYEEGLELIKNEVEKMGIEINVNGPEMHMTEILRIGLGSR